MENTNEEDIKIKFKNFKNELLDIKDNYPSYEDIEHKMLLYITDKMEPKEHRMIVLEWLHELNGMYYLMIIKMVDIINNAPLINENDSKMKELDLKDAMIIELIGIYIHAEGGLKLRESLYYIITNMLECEHHYLIPAIWSKLDQQN